MTTGTKGSDVYDGMGSKRLELSASSVRRTSSALLSELVVAAWAEDPMDTFLLAFHAGNVRGGKGERDVFIQMLLALYGLHPEAVKAVLELVPHYASWNTLLKLSDMDGASDELKRAIANLFATQLKKDMATPVGQSISLAAKWAPREKQGAKGAGSKGVYAAYLARILFPPPAHPACIVSSDYTALAAPTHSHRMKQYRQLLTQLNARLDTVETHMAGGSWATIKPATVPGRAGKLYAKAFLNQPLKSRTRASGSASVRVDSEDRTVCATHFREHFAAAAAGKATVHGSKTVFPHELVKKAAAALDPRCTDDITEDEKNQLRAVWSQMVKDAAGLKGILPMCDFSGSMQSSSNGDTPYWVSMALGMLCASAATGPLHGFMLPFDSNPHMQTLPVDGDLFDCVHSVQTSGIGQGYSTDFQKACDAVLKFIVKERFTPEQVKEHFRYLLVLTDMAFDQAQSSAGTNPYTGYVGYNHVVKTAEWQTHLDAIRVAFQRTGETMWGEGRGFEPPVIVLWNLAANPKDFHATAETPGVIQLSGWSPTQFAILKKDGPRQITPMEALRMELDDPQYDLLRTRLLKVFALSLPSPLPSVAAACCAGYGPCGSRS